MVRDHLDGLPSFPCPPGYSLRTFGPGDETLWARIETLAGEFPTEEQALERFAADYAPPLAGRADRCFLLRDAHGTPIGTATVWYGQLGGEERGRVSWVGIIPSFQGRGLAKPLLSSVLARLASDHHKAYLTTQTTSYRAINLYLHFAFQPYAVRETCEEGWRLMEQVLRRPIL
jgi:GNAT superfamily N-acetyltransferase